MTDIAFYHLEHFSVAQTLPKLLEKAVSAQYRILVRVADEAAMEEVDTQLWTYDPGSFLPHATVGQGFEADQPILITVEDSSANNANLLTVLDGNLPGDVSRFERCLYIFNGQDPSAVELARNHWKKLKADAHLVTYWQQSQEGRWEKKA